MADLFEVRKKKVMALLEDPRYVPMKEKELAALMQVEAEDRPALKEVLESLLEEGSAVLTRRGRYIRPEKTFLVGTFSGTARGFGFVSVQGEEEDLFIPESCVHGAMPGDTVKVQVLPPRRGGRKEAEVVEILERAVVSVVGTYEQSANFGFVVPDDGRLGRDIFIPKEHRNGAEDGMKVVARIADYGDERRNPEGKIEEVLGPWDAPGVDVLSIVKGFGLPDAFGEKALNQAKRCAGEVSEADRQGRRDLRDVRMVTIDGEDAKDLDDAVSLTVKEGRYSLGVHIADVSNYVQENSALDREARERGTSVYLADRVIPMLPPLLSNGICSLNAGEDRLALSCLMEIDQSGNVTDYEIVESVIRVDRRMSYTQVKRILEDEDGALREEYREFVPMFEEMARLSGILRKKRQSRGAVDFDFPECKISLDRDGRPVEIRPYEHNVATRLIEDFMLMANRVPGSRKAGLGADGKTGHFSEEFRISFEKGKGRGNPSGTAAEDLKRRAGDGGGIPDFQAAAAQHEAGGLFGGVRGPFRPGSLLLLPFYLPHPAISGPADPPDHPGIFAGQAERKPDRTLPGNFARGGPAVFFGAAQGGRGRAGNGPAQESGIYAGPSGGALRGGDLRRDGPGAVRGAAQYGGGPDSRKPDGGGFFPLQ